MLRRDFFSACGLGIVGLSGLGGRVLADRGKAAEERGSAENVILVMLDGGMSQVDTFDVKTGPWTPADFDVSRFGNFNLPAGLFPNLAQQADKFSLLRCLTGVEQVHQRASYVVQTCQTFNPVFSKEHPHIGSIMAAELASSRRASDLLPAFMAMNAIPQGPGLLPSSHAAFVFEASNGGVPGLRHPGGEALFRKRYESLLKLDAENRRNQAAAGALISDYHNFYVQGESMTHDAGVDAVFEVTDADLARYGDSTVGRSCAVAVKALAADLGTRVVQISHRGWDHHFDIYDRAVPGNLYDLTSELDPALAALLEDLAGKSGKRGGTLLDETMVVVVGEFGRTPADLTGNLGRDHYPYAYSALVAGGGVIPGQAFGGTDPSGYGVTDRFWSINREPAMEDLIATMYSSMGIDWTTEIAATPSGRVYEYTPKINGQAGYYQDIAAMFG